MGSIAYLAKSIPQLCFEIIENFKEITCSSITLTSRDQTLDQRAKSSSRIIMVVLAVVDLLESDIIKYMYRCFTDANRSPSEGNSADYE